MPFVAETWSSTPPLCLPNTPLQGEVATRIEKGTGCLQCGMAKRAGVIDRCVPLECRQVLSVSVSTCNSGKNHRPFALSWILDHTCTLYLKSIPTVWHKRKSDNSIVTEWSHLMTESLACN